MTGPVDRRKFLRAAGVTARAGPSLSADAV